MSDFLSDYGLVVLFGIIALQACGVPGLPGKTSLVIAAILAARGHFELEEVLAVAAVAGIVGGYAGYGVGRAGARGLLTRFLKGRALLRAETFFDEHGTKAVFLARFLPGLKVVAALAAGACCMRWRAFAFWHALGAIGFALVFGLTAYWAGEGAIELAERYGVVAAAAAAAVAVLAWLSYRYLRQARASAA